MGSILPWSCITTLLAKINQTCWTNLKFPTIIFACIWKFLKCLLWWICIDAECKDNDTERAQNPEISRPLIQRNDEECVIKRCSEIEEVQNLREKVSELQRKLQDDVDEIQSLQRRIYEVHKEKGIIAQEKEDALTRLSEIAGARLKYNNPGITDLSDDNRPNKLSEKFSELYDNEWTEAFEELGRGGIGEVEIIERLLGLLEAVYIKCKEMTSEQRNNLVFATSCVTYVQSTAPATLPSLDNNILKTLTDLQKDIAKDVIPCVIQAFHNDQAFRQKYLDDMKLCQAYFNKCITLCWLMCVQDPPIALLFCCPRGSPGDLNLFRHYTKSGSVVDYLVWPAMLLHENGPLLQKGVYQPQ